MKISLNLEYPKHTCDIDKTSEYLYALFKSWIFKTLVSKKYLKITTENYKYAFVDNKVVKIR
jgi:hypothetical protein